MQKIDIEFNKFNKVYKEKLEEIRKEKKITDLFKQVDEALKRVKNDELHSRNTQAFGNTFD